MANGTYSDKCGQKKCEMMHFGELNQGRIYTVNDRPLGNVVEQRDRGVHVHGSLKEVKQVDKVMKAYGSLAFMEQSIAHKILMTLQLEYWLQFWSPHYRCN